MKTIMKAGVLAMTLGALVALPAEAQKQKDLDRVEEAKASMIEKDAREPATDTAPEVGIPFDRSRL